MIEHRVTGTGRTDQRSLLGALARADAEGSQLLLDMTPLDAGNPSKRRLNYDWMVSLSCLLLGRYGHLPIRAQMPGANSIELQLLRSSFYFALAQRPGKVSYSNMSESTQRLIEASSGEWSPRSGPVLFPTADGERIEDRTYLYSNTHVRAESGYFRRYEASAAFPWLGDVIPNPNDSLARTARSMFISAVCDTLAEVLDNVSTHAFNLRDARYSAGWLGPGIVERSRSCLLVSHTAGGKGSFDRLHFLAVDNGFSVPRTLRWQHPTPLRYDAADDLIIKVLRRRLTDRGIAGHNGAGLWFLYGLARFAGGSITIQTEDDYSDGRNAAVVSVSVPPAESGSPGVWKSRMLGRPLRGTAIHLQIKVPSLIDTDPAQLARRIEDFREYRAAWPAMT